MQETPVIDGRSREEILEHITEIAPYYVDDWDPTREDAGTVLFEIFSDMTTDVIERLDRVPEKHQAAFMDALDFEMHPPQPARTPVTFQVDESNGENVRIPPGTAVASEEAQQRFETTTDRAFEATPASITDAYAVDPGLDRILDHTELCTGGEPTRLFTGRNRQRHELYLGHDELLNLNPGSVLELSIRTNATLEAIRDYLEWEYYGEDEDGEEGWHPLSVAGRQERSVAPLSERQQVESFVERQEPHLNAVDYELVPTQEGYGTLLRSLAHATRTGQFGPLDPGARDADDDVFPAPLLDTEDVPEDAADRLLQQIDGLRKRLESMGTGRQFSGDIGTVSLSLELPGETGETEVDGVETRWIRCRIPEDELATPLFDVLVESVRVSIGSDRSTGSTGLAPDRAITNDVVLELEGDRSVRPLGDNPTEAATFNLACEEAFTKPGAAVELVFEADDWEPPDNDAEPELVWEYWDGNGWSRLTVEDATDRLQEPGTVSFEVPADISPTSVGGHERNWIRTRLVSGNYGELKVEGSNEQGWERTTDHICPPEFDDITIQYSQSDIPFSHLLTHNNLTYEDHAGDTEEFPVFRPPTGDSQALYLGFDAPLRGGPLHLYLPMEGTIYPPTFSPRINVEYCTDPKTGEWNRLDLRDGTAELTERGILEFSFPEPTEAFRLFGARRHWIRIRVTGDEFTRSERGVFHKRDVSESSSSPHELSTATVIERERTEQSRTPPVVTGLHINTDWAENTETVDEEILGSSDETADQRFEFSDSPVLDATVWVDELESLSTNERTRLENDESTRTRSETDDDGELSAFWVQWREVEDFFDADAASRVYVLNKTDGSIRFGNGKQGAIPPVGENNVVADYETGGGDDGNVDPGAIVDLEDDIEFVDGVTNPGPGENGEDREPLSEFVSRAPKRLRDRGKPITRDGFERIALSAAREIAQVSCKAGEAETGAPGHVTLLVVPQSTQRKPVPSEELLTRVEETMREQAPEAVAGDQSRLTVRGPKYVEVTVDATIETSGVKNTTIVQETAEDSLEAFSHPITGGEDDDGWEIGTVPPVSAFTAALERLDDVDRVVDITVTYREGDAAATLAGGEGRPTTSPDVLIHSGRHEVTVEVAGE